LIPPLPTDRRAAGMPPGAPGSSSPEIPSDIQIPFEVIGRATGDPSRPEAGGSFVVLRSRLEDGQDLIVAGTVLGAGDPGSPEELAKAWRDRWLRVWRRSILPDKLIVFFHELNGAETEDQVREIVATQAIEMVGGYRAYVLLRGDAPGPFDVEVPGDGAVPGAPRGMLASGRFSRPGLVSTLDLREIVRGRGADDELREMLSDPAVVVVAHVPLGERGTLLLTERRSDRVFWPDDWQILSAIGEQGEQALLRLRLLEQARTLSLTDPLTGLANRRQMELVFRHAWAAAVRGEGLALLMLDLDHFKNLNDRHGHAYGDEILCVTANALRGEARGYDAVVRYGGDEFLVILPRGSMRGAEALAARVRRRLKGVVEFSAGMAAYEPGLESPAELIKVADANLYRQKSGRGALERSSHEH